MTDLSGELISIIVPAYNSERFIAECLNSIKNQTYINWECIVVDDHSSDSTFDIVSKYTVTDNRFKVVKRPNSKKKGANSCRNYGLELANGALIKWFDSDDIMYADHLKTVVETLESNDYDFVVTESQKFDSNSKNLGKPYDYNFEIPLTAENVALNRTGWITNDLTLKREALGDLRFNENLLDGHEYNLNVRMLSYGLKGKITNKVLSKYRQYEGTISHNRHTNDIKYLSTLLNIKYFTATDLSIESNASLAKWFIAGYMRLTFELAKKGVIHSTVIRSLPLIVRNIGLVKTLTFLLGIISGLFLKKGYNLVKYARQS